MLMSKIHFRRGLANIWPQALKLKTANSNYVFMGFERF